MLNERMLKAMICEIYLDNELLFDETSSTSTVHYFIRYFMHFLHFPYIVSQYLE